MLLGPVRAGASASHCSGKRIGPGAAARRCSRVGKMTVQRSTTKGASSIF